MRPFLLLILLALATYRITRLVTADDITAPARHRIIGEDGQKLAGTRLEKLGELLGCYWCVSMYVSAGLILIAQQVTGGVWYPWLAWPAVAAASALIATWEVSA